MLAALRGMLAALRGMLAALHGMCYAGLLREDQQLGSDGQGAVSEQHLKPRLVK